MKRFFIIIVVFVLSALHINYDQSRKMEPANPEKKSEAPPKRETRYKGMTPELYQATYEKVRTAPRAEDFETFLPTNQWYCVGPYGMEYAGSVNNYSGRCLDIEVEEVPGYRRVASAQGGLWDYNLGFAQGVPLSDELSSLEIGSFASHPGNTDRIVIGTGEPVGSGDSYIQGVFKTTNKGVNWIPATVNPAPGAVYKIRYGGIGALYYMAAVNGFYRSDDEGFTWYRTDSTGMATDFDFDVNNVYIGVSQIGIRKSTNFGATFSTLTNFNALVPDTTAGDIKIAVAPSDPSTLYTVVANWNQGQMPNATVGIFKSTNSGINWSVTSSTPEFHYDQGLYNNAIAVSPIDANLVLAGGGALVRTTDGGTTWNALSNNVPVPAAYHVDIHRIRWRSDGSEVNIATDGGWSYSWDGGLTWEGSQNTLPITQFYSIDGAVQNNQLVVIGGSQDNGGSVTTNSLFDGPGTWNFRIGGDGGQVELDEFNPGKSLIHSWGSGSRLSASYDFLQTFTDTIAGFTDSTDDPFFIPLHDDLWGRAYAGFRNTVRRLSNFGTTWTQIGGTLPARVIRVKSTPGYLGNSDDRLYAVLVAPLTRNIWVYESRIGAWQNRFNGLPNVLYENVAVHPKNLNVAFAMVGDVTEPNKLFITNNRGISWLNITGDLIDVGGQGLMVRDVVAHPYNQSMLFIGTQFGCWRTTNGGTNWQRWNNQMPVANEIMQMRLIHNPTTNKYYVLAGSHGRGAWIREITGNDPATGTAYARLRARLQGTWNISTQTMNNGLNQSGDLISHFGTQLAIPSEAVDSINIEIRDSASSAASGIRNFRPAWLLTDGTIRDFNDTTKDYVEFDDTAGFYYLVVRHRNHIKVMSASPQFLDNNSQSEPYDFTLSQSQAYGVDPMKELPGSSFYGLYSGDADGDGVVSTTDVAAIGIDDGMAGYLGTDVDLSGTVSDDDINFYTNPNLGRSSQVPDEPFRSYTVNERWNLVSLPLIAPDRSKAALYPASSSNMFSYEGTTGYEPKDSLEYGTGYWLKFPSNNGVTIEGTEIQSLTIPVQQGWNIIGSIGVPVDVASITSNPSGMIASHFFGYNNGYTFASTIEPMKGYWVKVNQDGELILSSVTGSASNKIRIVSTSELPPLPPDGENSSHEIQIPKQYMLDQNYPNPFNPSTMIRYGLPERSKVVLKVYDLLGREVAALLDETQDAGYREIEWDASNLPSGIYFYRITSSMFSDVKKMVLMK